MSGGQSDQSRGPKARARAPRYDLLIHGHRTPPLEEQLLQPEVRKDPAALSHLLGDDFLEFGASGRVYDKAATLEALASEPPAPPALLSHFSSRSLAENVVLVTYRTTRYSPSGDPLASVQRSSIWVHRDSRWQITFHQGTPLP